MLFFLIDLSSDLGVFFLPFLLSLMPVSPSLPQVRGHSFKRMHAPCSVSGREQGGGGLNSGGREVDI